VKQFQCPVAGGLGPFHHCIPLAMPLIGHMLPGRLCAANPLF
jgi:hypothetical protein